MIFVQTVASGMQHAHVVGMSDESEQLKKRTMLCPFGVRHCMNSVAAGSNHSHQLAKLQPWHLIIARAVAPISPIPAGSARRGGGGRNAGMVEFIKVRPSCRHEKRNTYGGVQLTNFSASVKTAERRRDGRGSMTFQSQDLPSEASTINCNQYQITRLPNYPITQFTAFQFVFRTPARARQLYVDRMRRRCVCSRRGIPSGIDNRPSDPSAARRRRDR